MSIARRGRVQRKSLRDQVADNTRWMKLYSPTGEAPPLPKSLEHLAGPARAYTKRVKTPADGLTELQYAIRLTVWWDKNCADFGLPPYALFAIPNGGGRAQFDAKNLQRSGVRPGIEDYLLPVPRDIWHGLFIELKADDGDVSAEQREVAEFHRAQGYQSRVAWGHEEAIGILREYLTPSI